MRKTTAKPISSTFIIVMSVFALTEFNVVYAGGAQSKPQTSSIPMGEVTSVEGCKALCDNHFKKYGQGGNHEQLIQGCYSLCEKDHAKQTHFLKDPHGLSN